MSRLIAYTVTQAAQATGIPAADIQSAVSNRKLAARLAGPHLIIAHDELVAYVRTLPNLFDGFDTGEVTKDHAAKFTRGREIATKLMTSGSLPGDPGFERGKAIAAKLLGRSQKT